MSITGWSNIISAVQAWVVAGSGLDDGKVLWARQYGKQPDYPYVVLEVAAIARVGMDWRELAAAADPAPLADVRRTFSGHRMATLVIDVYDDRIGGSGLELLDAIMSSLDLNVDALDTAGAGIGPITEARWVGGELPVARAEVQLHVASEVGDYVTHIESLSLTHTVNTTTEVVQTITDPDA